MSAQPAPKTLKLLADAVAEHLVMFGGDGDTEVTGIAHDSARVEPGDIFVCIRGQRADGHRFARAAVASGAVALVTEHELSLGVPEIVVTDSRSALALVAAEFFEHPSRGMRLIGVTGTNGKTTTTYLLESILSRAGHRTGLIGTIETRVAGRSRPGVRTTPDQLDLQRLLYDMRSAGVDGVAMEVTSHALSLHRVKGLRFASAVFTNLTQDHLDFHETMEGYFGAKRMLFVPEMTDVGAVNRDDEFGRRLVDEAPIRCITYGRGDGPDVAATEESIRSDGIEFTLSIGTEQRTLFSRLVGAFNLSNNLAAAAGAYAAGVSIEAIAEGLAAVRSVPGRLERVDAGQPFTVLVDYAHTPDSLSNVLSTARTLSSDHRVICVFGCGGDRDRTKRPLMGRAVADAADVVIVTSDNPRTEDPMAIIGEIVPGVVSGRRGAPDAVLPDRAEAIRDAIGRARPGDVVVIAGKGHETYQEIAGNRIDFDDRRVAVAALLDLGAGGGRP